MPAKPKSPRKKKESGSQMKKHAQADQWQKTVKQEQANKKTLVSELPAQDNTDADDSYGTKKWRRDFEEHVNRSLKEHAEQLKAIKEINRQLIAKMQAMQEMGEIYRQVDKRLKDGEWDKCRGLPREQQREILSQIYSEELVVRMQQDVFNKTVADWEEHRFRRIELIKWSKLPDSDKEKWLEFYNKPRSHINLIEGDDNASKTQEHPQTNEQ
ncbi:hypothetical protein L0337_36280 [candidate division KSB1 bacterium]|nr:hypothetical protein [candidate division KSB1 bacterium]